MRTFLSVVILAALAGASSAVAVAPEGWFLAGSDPKSYAIDVDSKVAHEGKSSARLASTARSSGFGTMMQNIDASEYRGKRLRLSSYVKSKGVEYWAGVWMRVDGPDHGKSLAFDNMNDRPIKGTKDWTRCDVVLDVPNEATGIAFGILVNGQGTVWFDDLKFEVVTSAVPTTGLRATGTKPANLNFER